MRKLLELFHPEGIPFPFSRLYGLLSRTPVFAEAYSQVADEVLARVRRGRVLDVGSGPGDLLINLAGKSRKLACVGLDVSGDMVAMAGRKAQRLGLGNAKFLIGNASSMPFENREFELVFSTGSIHHWKKPVECLDEIYRVLKDGGEAWIYDLPSDIKSWQWENTKKKYGRLNALIFRLHDFEEPFYSHRELLRLARSSKFRRGELEDLESLPLFKLVLRKK